MLDTAKLTFKTKNIPETETISAENRIILFIFTVNKNSIL